MRKIEIVYGLFLLSSSATVAQGTDQMLISKYPMAVQYFLTDHIIQGSNLTVRDIDLATPLPLDDPLVQWSTEMTEIFSAAGMTKKVGESEVMWNSTILSAEPDWFGFDDTSTVLAFVTETTVEENEFQSYEFYFRQFCPECAPSGTPIPGLPRLPSVPLIGGQKDPFTRVPSRCLVVDTEIKCY